MRRILCPVLVMCMLFMAANHLAQSNPTPKNANPSLDREEENLNVFDQWIRWNNPGSLLINHLNKLAFDYYEKRDREIAKLKTESDWQNRQKWVKSKLLEIVGPFPEEHLFILELPVFFKRRDIGLRRLFMSR